MEPFFEFRVEKNMNIFNAWASGLWLEMVSCSVWCVGLEISVNYHIFTVMQINMKIIFPPVLHSGYLYSLSCSALCFQKTWNAARWEVQLCRSRLCAIVFFVYCAHAMEYQNKSWPRRLIHSPTFNALPESCAANSHSCLSTIQLLFTWYQARSKSMRMLQVDRSWAKNRSVKVIVVNLLPKSQASCAALPCCAIVVPKVKGYPYARSLILIISNF